VVVEMVGTDEAEPVGQVGVAGEVPGPGGDELVMMVGDTASADRGEVGDVVGAALAAGNQVMDLQAIAPT